MRIINCYPVKIFFFFIFMISLFSCNSKTVDQGFYHENFDNMKWWTSNSQTTSEQAHSGSFSSFTDSTNEYSETFEMDLAFAKKKKYRKAQITAWCFKPVQQTKVTLVASVEAPDSRLTVQSLELGSALEVSNTWINLILFLYLPDEAPAGTKIKVYLHSPEGEKAFIDDVEIRFMK